MLRPFSKKEKPEIKIPPTTEEFEESEDLKPSLMTKQKPVAKPEPVEEEPEQETEQQVFESGEVVNLIEYHLQKAFQLLQTFK